VLAQLRKQFEKDLARLVDKESLARLRASGDMDERFLQDACPAFTRLWLLHALERLHEPLPELVNRDGEALVFFETRFPFPAEQPEEITHRLDDTPDRERDNPDGHPWIWLTGPDTVTGKPQRGMSVDALQDGQPLARRAGFRHPHLKIHSIIKRQFNCATLKAI